MASIYDIHKAASVTRDRLKEIREARKMLLDKYGETEPTIGVYNDSLGEGRKLYTIDPNLIVARLVKFCVLMQNGEGIVDKSPEYIKEKFVRCIEEDDDMQSQLSGLDSSNKKKLIQWLVQWELKSE